MRRVILFPYLRHIFFFFPPAGHVSLSSICFFLFFFFLDSGRQSQNLFAEKQTSGNEARTRPIKSVRASAAAMQANWACTGLRCTAPRPLEGPRQRPRRTQNSEGTRHL